MPAVDERGRGMLDRLVEVFVPDRRRVLINADYRLSTRRWALAHALGHHILQHAPPRPFLERVREFFVWSASTIAHHEQQELEANYFAACLLLPPDEWLHSDAHDQSVVGVAQNAASRFRVSRWAALHHLVEESPRPRVLLVLPRRTRRVAFRGATIVGSTSASWRNVIPDEETERLLTRVLEIRWATAAIPDVLRVPVTSEGSALRLESAFNTQQQFVVGALTAR